ncbi:MAG: hypothetical protein ACRDNW_02450 [Trebonia sp.]
MRGYEWMIYDRNENGGPVARHSGICETADKALMHLDRIMQRDDNCVIGVAWPSKLDDTGHSMNWSWQPAGKGEMWICYRLSDDRLKFYSCPVSEKSPERIAS